MYAIVEAGGRQWRVEPGTQFVVNRVEGAVGSQHIIKHVLLAHDGQAVTVGKPYITGGQVLCEVLEHQLGPKVITYKFTRRENFRRTKGHRQQETKLLVKAIKV